MSGGRGKASPIRLSARSPVAQGKVPEGRRGATRRMPHQATP